MNERERFRRLFQGQPVDRPPLFEEGVRDEVIAAWRRPGLAPDATHMDVFGLTEHERVGPDIEVRPADRGRVMDLSYREYRSAFDVSRNRFPDDWSETVPRLARRTHVACVWAARGFFQALGVIDWATRKPVLAATLRDPAGVRARMEMYADFCAEMLAMTLRDVEPEFVYVSEPISDNHGPLISPAMFGEFVAPCYLPDRGGQRAARARSSSTSSPRRDSASWRRTGCTTTAAAAARASPSCRATTSSTGACTCPAGASSGRSWRRHPQVPRRQPARRDLLRGPGRADGQRPGGRQARLPRLGREADRVVPGRRLVGLGGSTKSSWPPASRQGSLGPMKAPVSLRRALALGGLLASAAPAPALATGGRAPAKAAAAPVTVFEPDYAEAAAYRYANLDREACFAELGRRGIVFTPVAEAPGVDAPVRIPEGVGGVRFHIELPAALGRRSPFEVFDCRLVLALGDFARILRGHGVDDVVIFSAWRPPPKSWPADQQARRHPAGLAVDVKRLRVRIAPPEPMVEPPAERAAAGTGGAGEPAPDATGAPAGKTEPAAPGAEGEGKAERAEPRPAPDRAGDEKPPAAPTHRWLDVEKDFHGRIGAQTCGPGAAPPTAVTAEAAELRAIVCAAATARLFTSMLTPNYDRDHFNHLHLEVAPGVKWRIAR